MSAAEEEEKLQALKNALSYKNNPEMKEIMHRIKMGGLKWGDLQYYMNMNAKARETTAERAAREKKEAENAAKEAEKRKKAALNYAKLMNIEKKKARHMKKNTATGKRVLQKIAKLCKWECQGEKCWAHEGHACPFIHKGQPGWNEKSAVPKPTGASGAKPTGASGAAGAVAGSSKKQRRSSRKQRQQTRRRHRQN